MIHRGFLVTERVEDGERVRAVWEPTTSRATHGTVTFAQGKCWGRVGTEALPGPVDALRRGSPERAQAVAAFLVHRARRAAILLARATVTDRAPRGRVTT